MPKPIVSVCIPTYRGAAFLAASIDSVLRQSYPHFELVVLDDNSPDDTQAVVAHYTDPRIKYVRNATNLGPQGNWNRCQEMARGKYYKLLPHDDVLAADCLQQQVAVLEADQAGEIALVFGVRQIIDPTGRVLMTRGLQGAEAGRIAASDLIRRVVRAGANPIGEPGNGLIRRELVNKVGLYDASHPYLVDLDYWFRVLMHGDAWYTATQASSFRLGSGSWSVTIGNKQYHDFKGFVNKFQADVRYQIVCSDRIVGLVKAWLNTVARAVFYWYLFSGKIK